MDAVADVELRHLLLVIDEDGLDGRHLRLLDLGEEGALLVAIRGDRRDLRGGDLLHALVLALAFEDDDVAVFSKVFVCPLHDVLLGDFLHAVELCHLVGPVGAGDERLHVHVGPRVVVLEGAHHVELEVVDRRLDELFVEVARAELGHLREEQVADLLERLSGLGSAAEDERTVVGLSRVAAVGAEHLLLLVQIEVDQTGLSVVEDGAGDLCHVVAVGRGSRQAPSEQDVGGLQTVYLAHDGLGDRLLGLELELRQVLVGHHVAEVLVDRGDHLVGIQVTREADGHVVGHVVGLVVVPDVGDRRILQVLLRPEHGLRAVGMVGEERGIEGLPYLAAVLCERHVLLLVDGLQLGVEPADHGIAETVGLDLRPVLDLVRGDVLDVDGHVLRRIGVGAVGADGGHQLVVFVRDRDFRGFVADRVDAVVDRRTLGLVRRLTVGLEELLDLIEQRFLGFVVRGTEVRRTLEHEVFEVVGQTGGLGRVVLAADADGDVGLDAGRLLVDAHVDLQSVRKGVDPRFHRIARYRFVLVLAARRGEQSHDDGCE
ncbi:unknown [Alistipes sp. CAG:268]|nr:unknown [Alistipes sp. CAG:268]